MAVSPEEQIYHGIAMEIARRYGALDGAIAVAILDFKRLPVFRWPAVIEQLAAEHMRVISTPLDVEYRAAGEAGANPEPPVPASPTLPEGKP